MAEDKIATGVIHEVPDDLREALISNPEIVEEWNRLTLLARNERICWIISVKK
ncbi:YdeI/OmpD-associated family protein [Marispirochaeta sp.]|uniref:YdeI/OmpD-associated family protein n=1 Tax=Marispirochaeta sp. TaxID=2038653 RepID=UPI0029C9B1DD|nr:YdeI/OmpD-associated family protein [Marispirochaeta sp.]